MMMDLQMYIVKKDFYAYLRKHPTLLQRVDDMDQQQASRILVSLEETTLQERCRQYFEDEHIYLENHILHYEHKLRQRLYKIKIDEARITIYDSEQNPLFPFLKRLYREQLTIMNTTDGESYKKCCKNVQLIVK